MGIDIPGARLLVFRLDGPVLQEEMEVEQRIAALDPFHGQGHLPAELEMILKKRCKLESLFLL